MIYGMDYLGGAQYKDVILKNHPQGWAAGFFLSTFGDATKIIRSLAITSKAPVIRIHLLWSDTHAFGDNNIGAIKAGAAIVQKIKKEIPFVTFEISPFCEHNLKNPDKYLDIVEAYAPDCVPVNSVWQGSLSKKYKNEVHGTKAKAVGGSYNFSWDGQSSVDTDVEAVKKLHSNADVIYFWDARFNGKWEDNDKTPRPQRKGWPDSKIIRSLSFLASKKAETKMPKGWIYKSHAENKGNGDPRADKPVFICPIKARQIEIVSFTGKVIEKLPYYGTFEDRFRYYASSWGYEISAKAIKAQGYSECQVFIDGKNIGVIDPAFRDGGFR